MDRYAEVTVRVELAYFNMVILTMLKSVRARDFANNEIDLVDYLMMEAAYEILWDNDILVSIHADVSISRDENLRYIEITFTEIPSVAFRYKLKYEGILLTQK